MTPKRETRNPEPGTLNSKRESGFSLVSAIFLLVVIAALGTFAVTLSTTQNQSQAMDVMGARAYQAALAGVEWAAFNVAASPASAPAAWTGCTAGATVVVGGNLAAFSPVTVNCSASSSVEGASTIWVYDVSTVARTAGTAGNTNYVEQVATAKLAR
jgi:MSHA biogenesis protein MshP